MFEIRKYAWHQKTKKQNKKMERLIYCFSSVICVADECHLFDY